MVCVNAAPEVPSLFLMESFFCIHGRGISLFFDMFADLAKLSLFVVVFELRQRMCDRFGWTLDLNLAHGHS